jgi:hypothetical protein
MMEPGEKFIKRVLKFVLMIVLFIIAIVFDEFGGKGWFGLVVFVIGATVGALAVDLFKSLKN